MYENKKKGGGGGWNVHMKRSIGRQRACHIRKNSIQMSVEINILYGSIFIANSL